MEQIPLPGDKAKQDVLHAGTLAGRAYYWSVLIGYGCIELSFIVLALQAMHGRDTEVLSVILRALAFFLLWLLAYTGRSWARKVLGALFAVGLLHALPYACMSLYYWASAPSFAVVFLVSITVFVAFCLWAMWFSPQVNRYEKAMRRAAK